MNLERLGSITSELSTSLLKSIVVPPGGLLGWFTRHFGDRARERQKALRTESRSDEGSEATLAEYPAGPVVLSGGLPLPDEAVVEAIHLAGGRAAKVAVIPVASAADPGACAANTIRLFTRFGMKKVEEFTLDTREKAVSHEWCSRLAEYDAVVLCGESPSRGLEVLQATLASVVLREMVQAGKLLVALDAAAAILGVRVFATSEADETTTGLGILPGLLLDTEFTQSARFARMARAMRAEERPSLLGVGLDAGAALTVIAGDAKVLGESSVTFVDSREGDRESDGFKVHLLTDGYRMHLRVRRPILPKSEAVAR